MPGDGFVTSGQWKNARRLTRGRRTKIMSHDTDTIAMSLIVRFILLAHLSRDLTGTRAADPVR